MPTPESRGKTSGIVAVVLAFFSGGLVHGQVIEEITVTTRRIAENIQDVPIAITAVGTAEIQKLNIQSLEQVVELDTSVRMHEGHFSGGGAMITMRGLSPVSGRPNVATLIDGIDVTSEGLTLAGGSMLINPRLIDVARIEIVKGPQNVLYGRSAFAGAIQYVTKDPTDKFYAEVGVDIAQDGYEVARGSISGPISDTLGYRINGLWYDGDGFYRNSMTGDKIGGAEGWGGALTLKWEPTDRLSFKWRTDYSDDEFGVPARAVMPVNTDLAIDPLASECNTTPGGFPGPVADRNCSLIPGRAAETVSNYLDSAFGLPPPQDPITGYTGLGLGTYDPVADANQFHDMVWPLFTGHLPTVSELEAITGYEDGIAISPNYQWGPGAIDPTLAEDYPGTKRDVLRTSLVVHWAISDSVTLGSWTAWTDANAFNAQDADHIAEPGLLDPMDPNSPIVDNSHTTLNVHMDAETALLSQELRLALSVSDSVDLTFGGLYWNEEVEQQDRSSVTVVAGPQCYTLPDGMSDASFDPGFGQRFFSLNPLQHECGRTNDFQRSWSDDTFAARPETFAGRNTKHLSFYGSVDWRFTDNWDVRAEARWSDEETETTGPRMEPCWEPFLPNNRGAASLAGCLEPFGVVTGPGTVVLCGQTGRCDTADQSDTVLWPANHPLAGQQKYPNAWGWWPYEFAPVASRSLTYEKQDSWITPKLTLNYRPTDALMFYGSWAKAEKPGGFSLITSGTFGVDPNLDGDPDEVDFEPEKMTVWEIGGKTAWLDGRLFVNGAAFYQDFTDKQIRTSEVIGGTAGPVVRNAGAAEVWGVEMDVTWAATERLTLAGALTWLDSEYTEFLTISSNGGDIAQTGCAHDDPNISGLTDQVDQLTGLPVQGACWTSRSGNDLERAPPWTASAVINYTAPLRNTGIDWYVEWRTLYEDEQFATAENDIIVEARSVSDVWLGLQADRWDAQLYVRNVFDDDKMPSAGQTGPDLPNTEFRLAMRTDFPPTVLASPKIPSATFANLPNPRQAGIQFRYRFGIE